MTAMIFKILPVREGRVWQRPRHTVSSWQNNKVKWYLKVQNDDINKSREEEKKKISLCLRIEV